MAFALTMEKVNNGAYRTQYHDAYALSKMQQTSMAYFKLCRPLLRNDPAARYMFKKSLLTNAGTLTEWLHEERMMRQRWAQRSLRFTWLNYEKTLFGAPMMDPRSGYNQELNEFASDPMFLIDNLDVLLMFDLKKGFYSSVLWMEIGTLIYESLTYDRWIPYLRFRNLFLTNAFDQPSSTSPPEEELRNLVRDSLKCSFDPQCPQVNRLRHLLKSILLPINDTQNDNEKSSRVLNKFTLNELEKNEVFDFVFSILPTTIEWMPNFRSERRVSFFEVGIRGLGGFVSAAVLSAEPVLIYKAWDVGHKLSFNFFECNANLLDFKDAFEERKISRKQSAKRRLPIGKQDNTNLTLGSTIGLSLAWRQRSVPCLPERKVGYNDWYGEPQKTLVDGAAKLLASENAPAAETSALIEAPASLSITTPAVLGSIQLEMNTLSELTGVCVYRDEAERARAFVMSSMKLNETGFVPSRLVTSRIGGNVSIEGDTTFSIDAENDSFYEYLIKGAIMTRARGLINGARKHADVIKLFFERVWFRADKNMQSLLKSQPRPAHQEHWTDQGSLGFYTYNDSLPVSAKGVLMSNPQDTRLTQSPFHSHLVRTV